MHEMGHKNMTCKTCMTRMKKKTALCNLPASKQILGTTMITLHCTSLATVTPSLTILGEPYLLSKTTFLPFGPSVTPTRSASLLTPV
jgi:hypothetical protein